MICFQICIFVLVDTASSIIRLKERLLWFAFKFVFLYWLIQRFRKYSNILLCCDLLSNLYFCIGWYSREHLHQHLQLVVICFQICIFVLVDTAKQKRDVRRKLLWFAFKFVFLYWLIQPRGSSPRRAGRCDLLSNLYFCIGWYSTTRSTQWFTRH